MTGGRRARIVATVGPATSHPTMLAALVDAGVDVFRLNFSHGDLAGHGAVISELQALRRRTTRCFAILQDLPGPRVRVGELVGGGPVDLRAGTTVRLDARDDPGDATRVPLSYPWLADDVREGQRILLDDGRIELVVERLAPDGLDARVERGGPLLPRKGVNLPGARLRWPAMTERDEGALRFGLNSGVDLVALSFVRSARDADAVRRVMRRERRSVPLFAKIEKPEALDHLDAILQKFDGAMVARGDLGVELAPELVPPAQKRIIGLARRYARPVITATQMLESMTASPRPTRAEASDVANAVFDGSDALMLSAETSIGAYPLEAVHTMDRIIAAAEAVASPRAADRRQRTSDADAVARAACGLAADIGAAAIAVITRSGRTAERVSWERPAPPAVAFTDVEAVAYRLAIWWGVRTELLSLQGTADDLTPLIEQRLIRLGLAAPGDRIVIVGPTPIAGSGRTNFIKVHHLGS